MRSGYEITRDPVPWMIAPEGLNLDEYYHDGYGHGDMTAWVYSVRMKKRYEMNTLVLFLFTLLLFSQLTRRAVLLVDGEP